ncbi:MAG: DUF3568 family protein [Planctomycetes bacterium]|nr:DUF3568 family protein [Planctomycetota bacterium]
MRNLLLFLLVSSISLSCSGCAVALVGAGAASTVAYVKGDFESVEPFSVDEVFMACKSALSDLGIARISDKKDALSAQITARDASDKKVSMRIKYLTDTSSKLSIRISVFGDESKSRTIYLRIREHLNKES